ncbi:hypothetical protein D3C75_1177540 [compost metagenome]
MQGLGTSAGSTDIVLVTNPPAPPFTAATHISPSLAPGPAAVKTGLLNFIPKISIFKFAIINSP